MTQRNPDFKPADVKKPQEDASNADQEYPFIKPSEDLITGSKDVTSNNKYPFVRPEASQKRNSQPSSINSTTHTPKKAVGQPLSDRDAEVGTKDDYPFVEFTRAINPTPFDNDYPYIKIQEEQSTKSKVSPKRTYPYVKSDAAIAQEGSTAGLKGYPHVNPQFIETEPNLTSTLLEYKYNDPHKVSEKLRDFEQNKDLEYQADDTCVKSAHQEFFNIGSQFASSSDANSSHTRVKDLQKDQTEIRDCSSENLNANPTVDPVNSENHASSMSIRRIFAKTVTAVGLCYTGLVAFRLNEMGFFSGWF